jgi:hypothetical protein
MAKNITGNKSLIHTHKQNGAGFFDVLFGAKEINKYGQRDRLSSYDSETGYHLTAEQKRLRRLERHGQVNYSKAVESEKQLIDSYENLAISSRKYYQSYNRHLGNLITLDEGLGIRGLEETFKSQVIKNVFKGYDTVDRSNPLLLRNYLVSNATMPRNFRKEHLLSQIRFILRKFNPKDELLIQSIDITLNGSKASIKLRGINGELYERSAQVDKDFNLDMTDLKRNLKDVLLAIKRKMDFEIEIVSDFELGGDDIEIPGLMFINDDNALNNRLKNLQFAKSLDADGPIPLSQMSDKPDDKKTVVVAKRNPVFKISEPKPAYKAVEIPLAPPGAQIPGTQGFGEARQLETKPFDFGDAIQKILGGPAAVNTATVPAPGGAIGQVPAPGGFPAPGGAIGQVPAPGGLPAFAAGPVIPVAQVPVGMMGQQQAVPIAQAAQVDTRDEVEKMCNALTPQGEEVCKNTLGCFYNKKLNPPKCHRGMKIV